MNFSIKIIYVTFFLYLSSFSYSLTLEQLENKVNEQSRLIEGLSSGLGQGASASDRVTINGFLSASASRLFLDDQNSDAGISFDRFSPLADKSTGFELDNVVGLQFRAELSDDFSTTVQLIGRGSDEFEVRTELAYVAWDINQDLTARAGRLRTPFFLMSEYLEVGTAYIYARPPSETYRNVPITGIEGLDFLYRFDTGDWNHLVQLGHGTVNRSSDKLDIELKLEEETMLNVTSSLGYLTLHAGFSAGKVTFNDSKPLPGTGVVLPAPSGVIDINDDGVTDFSLAFPGQIHHNDYAHFAALGGLYDNGSILVSAEVTELQIRGFWPSTETWYLTLGKRAGKWLTYISYSEVEDTDPENRKVGLIAALQSAEAIEAIEDASGLTLELGDQIPGSLISPLLVVDARRGGTVNQTTYTFGLNYYISDNVVFKFQGDHIQEFDGTLGVFAVEHPEAFTGKHINMLTFAVDASF